MAVDVRCALHRPGRGSRLFTAIDPGASSVRTDLRPGGMGLAQLAEHAFRRHVVMGSICMGGIMRK